MNLSATQYKSISNITHKVIDKLNRENNESNLSETKKHFLEKITLDYHKKSYKQFTYFLRYISNGYNGRTGESMNSYDKYNSYKYQQNIYLSDNNKTKLQEIKRGQFLDNIQLQYANKKVAKALYIEYHNQDKNRLFLTLTLPSKYHYYKNKGKKRNPKCIFANYEESIQESLKLLNLINRTLHKKINIELKRYYARQNREYEPYNYLKTLEYHSTLLGHFHSILYGSNEQVEIMKKQYEKIVEKFELEETMCEEIVNKKGSSYVYKYLLKNSLPSENEDNSLFNKYKSYFSNVRIFSSSNFKNTTQAEIDKVYKYISKHRKNLMKLLKKSDIPLYVNLENMIKRGDFSFEYETVYQTVVDNKKLIDTATKAYFEEFIPDDSQLIYFNVLDEKEKYVKEVKIKRLTKAYYYNRYTNNKELIYDTQDFIQIQKTDFEDEFFGIYEDDPAF